MATYILLRNNKEEGPYSLNDLISKGLKAYDLVWIEGRSAGWRYPSEIEELKAYAPVVEEQPYDRFYKKSSEQTQTLSAVTSVIETNEPVVTKQQATSNEQLVIHKRQEIIYNEEPITNIQQQEINNQQQATNNYTQSTTNHKQQTTNKIFVTFPASQSKPVIKTTVQKPVVEEKKMVVEEKPRVIINKEPQLEEKFSQPLDDIKKMYVDSLLKQNKNKRNTFVIPEKLKIAAAALFLLLSGTAVGLLINRNKPSTEKVVAANNVPEQKVINSAATEQQPIIETPKVKTSPINNIAIESNHAQTVKQVSVPAKKVEPITKQEKPSEEDVVVNIKPISENRKTTKREQPATNNQQPVITNNKPQTINKPNLAKDLNITASNYKKATFGGISNLEFTVTNNSNYTIDMVAAEVEYYTANKKIYKTETIYFNNIAPNGTQVQKAPDSNRGYEVKYRISLISSKQLGLFTANL
ncbi:MAG: DUF4339 domain-containing protein [Sphingobacteriales bacterium]|nr:DUF4339 domain-containing protein [Sphingobacteriales bacterium]